LENLNIKVSSAPYIKSDNSLNKIMIDFIIALMPAFLAGVYFYKGKAITIVAVTIISSILAEGLWNKYVKKCEFLTDYSPIVQGLILGLILPTFVPLWIPVIASVFSIIVVKQFFGGFAQNFMNAQAVTKAFLITSWAGVMSKQVLDSTSAATEVVETNVSLFSQLLGQGSGGNIGELSILAICLGGLYLALRGRISLRGPIAFILGGMLINNLLDKELLLSGAFFFAAVFMTTDYGTTPVTKGGQYIFGFIAGALASTIVNLGYNSEGPYYAIIILNIFTPIIDFIFTKKVKAKKVV